MPRRPSVRCLPARPAALLALAVVAGCGDGPTTPGGAEVGFYRLRTIGGVALPIVFPPGPSGMGGGIREGQLILRGDGTLTFGIAAPLGGAADGTWRRVGDGLSLRITGGDTVDARTTGDSLTVRFRSAGGGSLFPPPEPTTVPYVFVRAEPTVAPVPDGTYALRTLDGRAPTADGFVVHDVMASPDFRSVMVIRWDTLVVRGPFVRRTEAVVNANGLPLSDPNVRSGGTELFDWGGAVSGDATRLVVRPFGDRWASGRVADTLTAATGAATPALVRTLAYPGLPTRTLRYERVR